MLVLRSFAFTAARRPAASALGRFGRPATRMYAADNKDSSAGAAQPPPPPPAQPGTAGATPAAETPENTIISLSNKVAELKDHLLRQMAETENVRKQGQQQVEDAKKFGVQALLKDLIHVIDTLDIALSNTATRAEQPAEEAKKELENFHEAIRVLEKDLHKALGQHGVARVLPPEGEDFNPNWHNALYTAPHDDLPKNKIAKVHKPGWTLHSRVIRAAQVGVSTGPGKKD